MTTRASNLLHRLVKQQALVRAQPSLWAELLGELAERGRGDRESGAFLLAAKHSDRRTVKELVFFDDLDPDAHNGAIHLRSFAFSRLWRLCRERGLTVIADVHTHPGTWVAQSSIDLDNPMIGRAGHIGIIVPSLARGSQTVSDIGFHIYRGDGGWDAFYGRQAERLLYIGWFA